MKTLALCFAVLFSTACTLHARPKAIHIPVGAFFEVEVFDVHLDRYVKRNCKITRFKECRTNRYNHRVCKYKNRKHCR